MKIKARCRRCHDAAMKMNGRAGEYFCTRENRFISDVGFDCPKKVVPFVRTKPVMVI
jgi:hypothetical protein